jgi:hypothetical protein
MKNLVIPANNGPVPLVQKFDDLPGAGLFRVTVKFYAPKADGTPNTFNPGGVGASPELDASKPESQAITITIEELVPPLDERTKYTQKRLLGFGGAGSCWTSILRIRRSAICV